MERSAMITICGRPNVGKSTLTNALVGEKIAIVSDKPQTTRNRIMGVHTDGATQLVFLDTPGAHRPHDRLGDFMMESISDVVSGVDVMVLVTEPTAHISETERSLLKQADKNKMPVILVINKIDTVEEKANLLVCIDTWQKEHHFEEILPISALTGDGVDLVVSSLKAYALEGPHFFPDDAFTDQTERTLAAELIREKMLRLLEHEIPHGIAVVIEQMTERQTAKGDVVDISAYIYCERESHKGIIIGKKGAMLKRIGSEARAEMEQMLGCKVNLQCWVKVKEGWRNRPGSLGEFGFTMSKD